MPKAPDPAKDILRAAKRGETAAVAALLDQDASLLNARDTDGSTPLHCASWKGHTETVQLLIERGADIEATNENDHWGDRPLHAAAHGNQRAVALLLVEAGADVNAKNAGGRTPLDETTFHKATAAARVLRAAGATG